MKLKVNVEYPRRTEQRRGSNTYGLIGIEYLTSGATINTVERCVGSGHRGSGT
jgi:hypothetical protein